MNEKTAFKFEVTSKLHETKWFIDLLIGVDGVPSRVSIHEGCIVGIITGVNQKTIYKIIKCNDTIVTIQENLVFDNLVHAYGMYKKFRQLINQDMLDTNYNDEIEEITKQYINKKYEIILPLRNGIKYSIESTENKFIVERASVEIMSKKYLSSVATRICYYCDEICDNRIINENVAIDSREFEVTEQYKIEYLKI